MQIPSLLEMLKAGLHFGHKESKRHPSMKDYIFTTKGGIHIIDLEKTQKLLAEALNFIKQQAAQGKILLLVGTKSQVQKIIQKNAEVLKLPYIVEKWVAGTLTNWPIVSRQVRKIKKMIEEQEKGEWLKYTKKEQQQKQGELKQKQALYQGLFTLETIPDLIFIIDTKKEKTALLEARRKNIPIIAVCDTNSNANLIDYPIPANDDSTLGLEMIVGLIAEAVTEGRQEEQAKQVAEIKT